MLTRNPPLAGIRPAAPHLAALCLAALCVLTVSLLAGLPAGPVPTANAAEQFPSSPNHRGIAPFDPYLVFPENRPGNGVYLDNALIFETEAHTIIDVVPLPVERRFAYYALDPNGLGVLGVAVQEGDREPRVTEVAPGFFHVVTVLGGVVYKKLYRIIDNSILDLLPASKTADGATAGPAGVVFYHVASAIRQGEEGRTSSAFGLRLHLARFDDERTRHLDYLVTNGLPRLSMSWLDDTRIEIGLNDGRTEVISTAQFR